MFLEGIIICVNYSDFLSHTLPHNKSQFDNLIVVTDKKDEKTKWLCEYYNVRCLQTDIFYENGDKFNKGAAINEGLKHLSRKGWVLHLDSDIYLPPKTRNILNNLELDPYKIYGADRLMCPSYEKWMEFLDNPLKIQEGWVYVHLNAFPIGVRLAEYENKNAGWEPLGYFQLWNPMHSGVHGYPTEHGFADRTDVLHAKKWERKHRELLPEIVVIHLDSEGLTVNQMGKNWYGRKTNLFTYNGEVFKDTAKLITRGGYKPTTIIKHLFNYVLIFLGITIVVGLIYHYFDYI
jgi:glycosyltransferase involved in cell wall biosynthesis